MALQETLQSVRERIARYRDSPINEQNTTAALIESILRALGWDLEDLEEVQREYKVKSADNPVDYALMVLRSPRLFVEAKALCANLDDRKWAGQIMGYASVAGVEWVVLTNGDEYRIYNAHAPVPVEDKIFRTVRLSDDAATAGDALEWLSKERLRENQIGALWKAHFADRQVRDTIEKLFSPEPDPSLVNLIRKHVPALSPGDIRASMKRMRVRFDVPADIIGGVTPTQPATNRGDTLAGAGLAGQCESTKRGQLRKERSRHRRVSAGVSLHELITAGIVTPPLSIEGAYKGEHVRATIQGDGTVVWRDQSYSSLSGAGGHAIGGVNGRDAYESVDGCSGASEMLMAK